MDCKRSVDFVEKGKAGAEFGEWKRGEGAQFHEPEHTYALQHQLNWLVLTLKASMATNDSEVAAVVAQVPAFLDTMLADWKKMKKFSKTLREPVTSSIFARYYKLDQILELPKNWSATPGDLDGVYEKTVLAYLKQSKNLGALTTSWQKRVSQTVQIFEIEVDQEKQAEKGNGFTPKGFNPPGRSKEDRYSGNAEERLNQFKKEGLPRLNWEMNVDLFQLGAEQSSSTNLLSIIRGNLGHPDAAGWLAELQALLKGEALPGDDTAPSSVPAPSPASEAGRSSVPVPQ